MTKFDHSNLKTLHVNRASVTFVDKNGEMYFATKRVANEIYANPKIETWVVSKEFQGKKLKWLGIVSTR